MIKELTGQKILTYEVFEPWCLNPQAQMDGTPVFGALALHTCSDTVLTLSSRLRFSTQPMVVDTSHGLFLSAMDHESWSLQRARWLERSQLSGARPVGWYRQTAHTVEGEAGVPFLPISLGKRITNVSTRPGGRDAVALQFEGNVAPAVFEYRADFDGGIGWASGALMPPKVISPFLPTGEFSWLHPATQIPVQYEGFTLKSALFEDWPLMLRRSIQNPHELPLGEPLRRSAQLLASPYLRTAYLSVVRKLLVLRFKQHPWLCHRLANLKVPVADIHEFGVLVNQLVQTLQTRQAETEFFSNFGIAKISEEAQSDCLLPIVTS